MRWSLITAFMVCSGVCSGGWAQGPGGPPRPVLVALDTDGDGTLSTAEIAAAPKVLMTIDRNGDGQLMSDEVTARPENTGATADELVKQMMGFDKNGDGALTPDELPARMQNVFARGDTNHDGKLTADEIRAMARRQGMPSGGAEGARMMGMILKNDPLLNALDANHDGVISADEIAAAASTLAVLDVNHDGKVTPDEMRPKQQTAGERVDHLLGEWDTDKDGTISKAEAPDRMQQTFASIDKNGDGVLDRAELLEYFKAAGAGQRGGGQREGARRSQQQGDGHQTASPQGGAGTQAEEPK